MTNRLLLGLRSGAYGLWISKPGYDALSAADADCLFSSNVRSLQVVQSGDLGDIGSTGSVGVAVPDQGFYPFVIIACAAYKIYVTCNSFTSVTIGSTAARTTTFGAGITSNNCRYAVLNQGLH